MLNKMINSLEFKLNSLQKELSVVKRNFQFDVERDIDSISFERNAMQTLLVMSNIKSEIKVLTQQLQLLKMQQKEK
jgi:hypothetical protein